MTNLRSTLTCPECGGVSTETMPTDACHYFYDCLHCGAVLRPLAGDCCVFCSYGDMPCPPIQEQPQGRHAGEHDGTAARATGTGGCCAG
jgi:hypothetical protein